MKTLKALAIIGTALTLTAGATASYGANGKDGASSGTVVIGGRTLGPAQGLAIHEEFYEETPGAGAVGLNPPAPAGTITPMWVSGSSYAYSQEILWMTYKGYGRAGGNVVNNERIVRVCFYWTQASRTSTTYCADAAFSGGRYTPGPEVIGFFEDTLDPTAVKTYFHVAKTAIDPRA
jgi:hypothetical protein